MRTQVSMPRDHPVPTWFSNSDKETPMFNTFQIRAPQHGTVPAAAPAPRKGTSMLDNRFLWALLAGLALALVIGLWLVAGTNKNRPPGPKSPQSAARLRLAGAAVPG